MDKISYKTPFHVKDGKIFAAENRYVTLWGVNYYAPFNHNFCNLAELGKDHCRAIDRDLDDLQLLGADFIRMHMFEREISDPAGNRDAAVRLAVRRLVAPLRLPPEESVLYEIPDYLYDHVTVIKEPLIELDGTLLQAGFTHQLRRCEVWSIPLEENVAADRKELLEALEDQGFSEADAPRRPFAGKADPNRIDLQYDDLLRATLVIPPSAVPAGDGVTPDGSNRFLLYVSETETEPLSGKAVRRYRKEQPRSFLAAGGFRSLDDAELADTFDRLAAIPGLTLGEQLRLYRDTAGEEQRAILGDRRAKLLAAIVERIAAMQAEPAFPGYMAQLLEAIDFATPSPGHEKQLGKLWPLV